MSQKGYVYILTNPSMPGLVKIGKTTRDVEQRANELYSSGVPEPFEVAHYVYSPDCSELEESIHDALYEHRVNEGREFFRISPEDAIPSLMGRLYDQLDEWVGEFAANHRIVHRRLYVDILHVMDLSESGSGGPDEVSGAMGLLTAEEIQPAIDRYKKENASISIEAAE